jgi:polysaccharide biosynthesis protein PslG
MKPRTGPPAGARRRGRRWLAPACLVAAILVVSTAGAQAAPSVPQGMVGMTADGPVFDSRVNLAQQLDQMVAAGVENIRVVFSWSTAQPYASWSKVPSASAAMFSVVPGGVPTDFTATDRLVGLAAQRGLTLLPVPLYAPSWDLKTKPVYSPIQPRRTQPYANYLTALVDRYGPQGTYWTENPSIPRHPIRQWQIWNEPNLNYFWVTQPFSRSYVALLRAAHNAIKRADPGAKVILAGLTNNSWQALAQIYGQRGAEGLFDAVAIHPYTGRPPGVIKILELVRGVMGSHGDARKPVLVTELGWPSSQGHAPNDYGLGTTPSGQARKLTAVIRLLVAARKRLHIGGFDVYTWMGPEGPGSNTFDYSGLLAFNPFTGAIKRKPAYTAFRRLALGLEDCRVKGPVATSCTRPG